MKKVSPYGRPQGQRGSGGYGGGNRMYGGSQRGGGGGYGRNGGSYGGSSRWDNNSSFGSDLTRPNWQQIAAVPIMKNVYQESLTAQERTLVSHHCHHRMSPNHWACVHNAWLFNL